MLSLSEDLRPLVTSAAALLSAVALLFFAWRKRDDLWLPGGKRAVTVWRTASLVTAVLVAILLIRFDHCSYIRTLLRLAGTTIIACIAALLLHWLLVRQVDPLESTWRNRFRDAGTIILYLGWNVFGTLALTAAVMALVNDGEARSRHRELQLLVDGWLVNEEDPRRTKPGLPTHFSVRHVGCNNNVTWSIEPPDLGTIENGTYSAPPRVARVRRVKVTAEAEDRDWEQATADVIIEPEIAEIVRTTAQGQDTLGNTGVFDVMVITQEHSWMCRSTSVLDGGLSGPSLIDSLARMRAFDPYSYLIAVGTASHEGRRQVEDARADQRAATLGNWLQRAVVSRTPQPQIRRINLGQYVPDVREASSSCEESRSERPLVIIGVITRDAHLDLASGLRNVFETRRGEAFFANILDRYPRPWTVDTVRSTRGGF